MFHKQRAGSRMLRTINLSVLSLFMMGFLALETAQAQGVSYTTISRGEFGGSLGTIMSMVPGAQDESRETVHVQGSLMRTDSDETSTIVNAGEGRFILLQHEPKTFFSYTMEEMMAAMSARMGQVEADEAQMEAEEGAEEAQPSFEVKVSTERTGRTMDVGGYAADQFLMIVEMIPTDHETQETATESGRIVILTEMWMSRDVPGWEALQEAQAEMAEQAVGAAGMDAFAQGLQQAFASDPRMEQAFRENAEAMKEMEGMAVKTVTSFVSVAAGKEFDADQVLAMVDQPLSTGMGEVAAGAAKEGAKEAARGAVRGLTRGLFGRKKEEPKEEAPPEPAQTIIMRTTSLVQDIRTGPLPDDLFQPPADYQETDPPWKGAGGV